MPVAPPPRAEAAGTAGTAAAPPGTAAWRCAGVWTSTSAARSAGSRAATGRAAAGWVCHSPRAALSDSGLRPRDASRAAPTASGLHHDGGEEGEGTSGSLQGGKVGGWGGVDWEGRGRTRAEGRGGRAHCCRGARHPHPLAAAAWAGSPAHERRGRGMGRGAWAEGHGLRGEGRGEHRGAVCAGGPPHVEAHPSIRPAARTYHVHTTHIIYHAHADRPAACAAAGARWAAVC